MVVVVEQGKEITQEQARHFRSADPLTFQSLAEEQEEEEEEKVRGRGSLVKATKCEINWELLVGRQVEARWRKGGEATLKVK